MSHELPRLSYDLGEQSVLSLSDAYGQYMEAHITDRPQAREDIARAALVLYEQHTDHSAFARTTSAELIDHVDEAEAQQLADPLLPLSAQLREGQPSEAIWATSKNLSIASRYATALGTTAEGVLLSGSSAWGSFYAPRGLGEKPSDVDMLCAVNGTEELQRAVQQLANADLVPESEVVRAAIFEELYASSEAKMFSLRTYKTNTEVSMHFLTKRVLESVRDLERLQEPGVIEFITDFRPNTSSNAKRTDGYELPLLDKNETYKFHPSSKPIEKGDQHVGYICESPIGGLVTHNTGRGYAMGVIPFFMAAAPAIVHDPAGMLQGNLTQYWNNIAHLQEGRPIVNLPRIEKMPAHTLRHIGKVLTAGYTGSDDNFQAAA